jgi:hypothetical protein
MVVAPFENNCFASIALGVGRGGSATHQFGEQVEGRHGGRAAQWEQVVVTQNRWSWAALVREKATGRGDETKGASIKCLLAYPEVPLGVFGIGVGIVKYGSLGGIMVTYLKIGYHTSF